MATRACLAVLAVAALATPGLAADPFVVGDVKVDVTAQTAAEARDMALAEGGQRAFRSLLERLTSPADWDTLPRLTSDEIAPYIQSFEVASEKSSAVRYIATLNYTFKEQPVRRLLADRNTPFAMTRAKPVAVVPVYTETEADGAEGAVLWGDPNPWREAWAARSRPGGLVPLILPEVDAFDASVADAEQALQGDASSLSATARRVGAYTVLVAQATPGVAGDGAPAVEVALSQYGPGGLEHQSVQTYTADQGESMDQLLARATDAVALELEKVWKSRNLVRVTGHSVTPATLAVSDLRQWQTVRERLDRIPVVQHVELVVLSRDHARLNLFHMGTPDQLAVALRQADLELSRQDTGGVGSAGTVEGAGGGGGGGGGAEGGAGGTLGGAGGGEAVAETWVLRLASGGAIARP